MPRNKRILVSGASIAGPALTYWLQRYGFEVTVVEKAPALRRSGQAVDFKGATQLAVLERMGILDEVRASRTQSDGDGIIVDAAGRRIAVIPAAFSGGDIEIARGELASILHAASARTCEYVFGDSLTALSEHTDGVTAAFEHSATRDFDLVVGADGIHSNVRRLVFGPESQYVRHLGYYYALADLPPDAVAENVMYNEPGRMVITGGSKAPSFFVFASKPLSYDRDDVEQQKRVLIDAFGGARWRVPALLQRLAGATEFYMDSISRVTVDLYARGRVALLGDAAYGNTLGGFGTGLAVVGAYVLAGELHRANGDYEIAYARYDAKLRGYAKVSQKVNGGKILAPLTYRGLFVRNRLFSIAPTFAAIMKVMDYFATDIALEDYTR